MVCSRRAPAVLTVWLGRFVGYGCELARLVAMLRRDEVRFARPLGRWPHPDSVEPYWTVEC
jgi:hypothetical protein